MTDRSEDPLDAPVPVVEANGWHRFTVEPRRPAVVRDAPRGYLLAVAAVCIGAFMGQLDASIVTLAFPALEHSFGADVADVSWVGLSYLLVLVATVAAVGRLADMVGRKLLYLYGFVVFVVGSALCATAGSLPVLDAYRVLQALGAAMLQANSVAIIALSVPASRLGRALGIQGAAQALGLALGPSLGGLLLAVGGWRLLFLVNVPVGIVGLVAALLFVPRSRHLSARVAFDWTGFGVFVPTVAAVMFAISEGNHLGWTSPTVLVALALSVVGVVSFVRWERRATGPLVDLTLFRRARFTSGVIAGMLAFAVLFGLLVVVPFELERARGLGTVATGLELMILPVALGITAPFSGRVADRLGARRPALAGLGVATVALLLLALLRPSTPGFVALLAAVGAGMGLFVAPNNTAIMASVPPEQSGLASGLLNMTRGLGTALGLAVTTAVYGALAGTGGSEGADHGFTVSVLVLAVGAAGAWAVVAAGTRGEGSSDVSQHRVGDIGLLE